MSSPVESVDTIPLFTCVWRWSWCTALRRQEVLEYTTSSLAGHMLISHHQKCFEWLLMHHITSILPLHWTPTSLLYWSKRSTDDAFSIALHLDLRPTCQNAVHQYQLTIQHNHPSAAHPQISPAGTPHFPVQLAAGLLDGEIIGRLGQRQRL